MTISFFSAKRNAVHLVTKYLAPHFAIPKAAKGLLSHRQFYSQLILCLSASVWNIRIIKHVQNWLIVGYGSLCPDRQLLHFYVDLFSKFMRLCDVMTMLWPHTSDVMTAYKRLLWYVLAFFHVRFIHISSRRSVFSATWLVNKILRQYGNPKTMKKTIKRWSIKVTITLVMALDMGGY